MQSANIKVANEYAPQREVVEGVKFAPE